MPDELSVGQKVGHYVVVSRIGAGGMGAVYLAEHPEIGRRVAIKVLSAQVSHQPGLAERFLAEARAVARIDHPNVITIHDFARTDDGQLYYVMEWLRGRELTRIIEEQAPMPPAQVAPYLEQICAGLQAAHEQGIVHRDLKPENVFVLERRPFTVKLLDFGIARLLDSSGEGSPLTQTGLVIGSPLTMAPEQAAGQRDRVGPRTDLYSLGVILYWMLSGQPPFNNPSVALLLACHIQSPPPPLRGRAAGVPPMVAEVVHRCLEKEPERRYGSADEVARAFAHAATHAGASVATGGAVPGITARPDLAATLPPDDGGVPATRAAVPPTVVDSAAIGRGAAIGDSAPRSAVRESRRGQTAAAWSGGPRGTTGLRRPPRRAMAIAAGLLVVGVGLAGAYLAARRSNEPARDATAPSVDRAPASSLLPRAPDAAPKPAAPDAAPATRPVDDKGPRPRPRPHARTDARTDVYVIIGKIVVHEGPLRPEAAHKVMRRLLDPVKQCYRLALRRQPGVYGRVALELTVGRAGRVRGAESGSASIGLPPAVGDCMAIAAKQLRFSVGPARLTVPFVLRPIGGAR
jgi:serine/threonine-protein kinase